MALRLLTAFVILALMGPAASVAQQKTVGGAPAQSADQITLTVTVTDNKGRPINSVPRDAFTLYDEKKPQQISSFSQKDEPLSMGILLDVSGSMRTYNKNILAILRENLELFIKQSHRSNHYFVISFSDCPQLLVDWTLGAGKIKEALSNFAMPQRGSTAFFDACYSATEKVKQGSNPKRALLVVTDAQDNNSSAKYKELRELLRRSDVAVYFVLLTDPAIDALAGFGREIAGEIARISGGAVYSPSTRADLQKVFEFLALELRSQYRIAYSPASLAPDSKWRKVRVKVESIEVEDLTKPARPRKKMDLKGRTREGYYTAKNTAKNIK